MSNEDTAKLVSPTIKQTNYSFYFGFNFEPMVRLAIITMRVLM